MSKVPTLTDEQKKRLRILEPALRNAARLGDYGTATRITADIQRLLRPTGHETRLMQAKNWLFQAAMLAGKIETAAIGLEGVRKKTNARTRVNLEATALLAVCRLRQEKIEEAKPLMRDTLENLDWISSESRRRQFRQRIIQLFDEETALAALRGHGHERLTPETLQDEAGALVQQMSEDGLLFELGDAIPEEVVFKILEIDEYARKLIPEHEVRYLPDPEALRKRKEIGRTVFSAIKVTLYRSICDPESEVYKAWYANGIQVVLDKKYISAAVVAALHGLGIGIKAIAVSAIALVIRFGVDVYCEKFKPDSAMIALNEK
ncbi:MAG: hypothetical protein WD049_01620 [Candidatus Paceibacterota bacterium]